MFNTIRRRPYWLKSSLLFVKLGIFRQPAQKRDDRVKDIFRLSAPHRGLWAWPRTDQGIWLFTREESPRIMSWRGFLKKEEDRGEKRAEEKRGFAKQSKRHLKREWRRIMGKVAGGKGFYAIPCMTQVRRCPCRRSSAITHRLLFLFVYWIPLHVTVKENIAFLISFQAFTIYSSHIVIAACWKSTSVVIVLWCWLVSGEMEIDAHVTPTLDGSVDTVRAPPYY